MPRIIELHTRTQEDSLINTSPALVILFKNPRCGHCITLTPKFEALSDQYPNVYFGQVDTATTKAIDLEGVPTMAVYKNGQCIDVIVGADEDRLKRSLDNLQGSTNNSRLPNANNQFIY